MRDSGGRIRRVVGFITVGAVTFCGAYVALLRQRRSPDALDASRAQRTARIAKLGARRARRTAFHKARRTFASTQRRIDLDATHQMQSAQDVAAVLGEMKGALMKLGQMASYLDETMPAPMREALATLQQDAPPMSAALAASVIVSELGEHPNELFAEWDPVPMASASIGQVHKAITQDGRAVAVKVQYPGVDAAIRADLDNTDMLFRLIGLAFPGLDGKTVVTELRARIIEELDYSIEARNQTLFAEWYRDHPFIHVPSVIFELSTPRVLTTDLVDGARFDDLLTWPQQEQQLAAETIFRFVFRSIYRIAAFNGDPHPGNYLFAKGGHVTFLDFGLVKHYDPPEVQLFSDLIHAMCFEHDITKFRSLIEHAGILQETATISDEQVQDYFGHFYDFVRENRVVTFNAEYASDTVRKMFDLTSPSAAVAKQSNVPPAFVITQRINLGLHAILAQLNATANWRCIAEELWPWVGGTPTTDLGQLEADWLAANPRA